MITNPRYSWFKRLPLYIFGALFLLLFASACQTFKGKSGRRQTKEIDSTKTSFMQNFTSKYNILYNAHLMLEGERKGIYDATNKNYQIRLTVFDEPTANGDPHKAMDSLIQKAYKIVNTKQESKYINEAYFIIGRAYYLKGSYYTAAEFFDRLIKDTDRQSEYKPLAYAWKSRSLLQINKKEAAGKAIDSAFMFLDESMKSRTFVNAAMANYLVRVGREGDAIPYLEYALESNKDKYDTGRWRFLLAQLYRDNGQPEKAYQFFNKLAKSNVPFDMSFEADLQAAFLTGNRGGGLEERVKPLRNMLREGKNMDYKDQILYEIGRIYLDAADEENAFKFFNLALAEPNGNVYQTTETYLTIADYHFGKGRYRQAQNYYDSTASVLPIDYTDVNKIRRKLVYMEELTALYEENLWLDTLISLGKLSDADRAEQALKFAGTSLIEKQKELDRHQYLTKKGKKGERGGSNANFSNAFAANNTPLNASPSNSQFYFNNQDALLLGASEFKRKWGNRQLKDDWRFSGDNAQPLWGAENENKNASAQISPKDSFDAVGFVEAEKARYLTAVPVTQEDYDKNLKTIHDNMVVIGNIYRDYTRDNHDAITAYETFLERFPNTDAAAEVYYSLYRMYDGIDQAKSLAYRERLLALFPNSLHAMVAKDPYYMDKVNRDKRILDRTFERLFALYAAGDHVEVIKQANEELEGVFQASGMVAQIEYLKALAIGRVGRVPDFTNALEKIIEKYPTDSLVVPLARENIAFIENNLDLFVYRVNALQDIDKSRVAFVDEPDMTPWPALSIYGDYRTGVAIAEKKLEEKPVVEETKEEVKVSITEEKRQEIAVLLANEMSTKPKEVKAGESVNVKGIIAPQKKDEMIVADLGTIEEEKIAAQLAAGNTSSQLSTTGTGINANRKLDAGAVNIGNVQINYGPNDYRDKKLFPDTATYFFTINVMDPRVNLAPSRYGIGQFNRSRYTRTNINHQLRLVNAENQLLFVGPFETFEEVKTYESRILPLLPEIMKVPQEDYNTFIITRETIGTLTDGIQIKNYHQVYIEQ